MKEIASAATLNLAEKLSEISAQNLGNPFAKLLTWPGTFTPGQDWHMAPELISLHGLPQYESLSEEEKKKLSFYETINFYSLNIHGERSLMEGLANRLYRKWPKEFSSYIHHFLGEENNHMVLFGGFCTRFAGKVYPDRHVNFPREYAAGEEDFLFFARVMIFEEIVDYYNYLNAKDERLHPVAREINRLHRFDESRHLAFGRKVAADLFTHYSKEWSPEVLAGVRSYLAHYLVATLKEYVNPDAYRDAGLSDPYNLAKQIWAAPSSLERRKQAASKVIHFFKTQGILLEEPEL